jgi:riboflavin transporter FmnP
MIPFSTVNVIIMAAVFVVVVAIFAVCIRRELK